MQIISSPSFFIFSSVKQLRQHFDVDVDDDDDFDTGRQA